MSLLFFFRSFWNDRIYRFQRCHKITADIAKEFESKQPDSEAVNDAVELIVQPRKAKRATEALEKRINRLLKQLPKSDTKQLTAALAANKEIADFVTELELKPTQSEREQREAEIWYAAYFLQGLRNLARQYHSELIKRQAEEAQEAEEEELITFILGLL